MTIKPIKISVCIIVKNEEKDIRKCLESIKNVVDEIIIVDGYSTDKTVDICKEYTDKIYLHKFSGSMAKERNFSISKASNEWIFTIDGDETLSEELKNYLRIFTPQKEYDAYAFARRNYYDENGEKWTKHIYFPDFQIRLFKNTCKFHRSTHEIVKIQGITKNESLNLYINHYVPNRYSMKEFWSHWIPGSVKLQAKWDEYKVHPKLYYILKLPFIFFWHFIIVYFKENAYKDGIIGLRVAFMMSMYFFMVNYYIVFESD